MPFLQLFKRGEYALILLLLIPPLSAARDTAWTPLGPADTTVNATENGNIERNNPPNFIEIPEQIVVIGDTLVLTLNANDPEGHPFKYALFREPEGAKINSETGQFLWVTSRDRHSIGKTRITVLAKELSETPRNATGMTQFTVKLISPKLEEYALKKEALAELDADKVSKLDPEIFTALLPEYLELFSTKAFTGLGPLHIEKTPRDVLNAMTLEQFANLPLEAIGGLTKRNISGLPPQIVNAMTLEQVAQVKDDEFKQLPGELVAQFLTNVNPEHIKPKDIQSLLPVQWRVDDETGRLHPPLGSRLNFRCLPLDNAVPDRVSFPSDRPDFNTGFSLGGQVTDKTMLGELNDTLFTAGLATYGMQQQVDGVLRISGTTEDMNTELALLADVNNMYQIAETAVPEVVINETGHYVMTTANGQELRLVPAPKDITAFYELAEADKLKIRDDGSLLIIPPTTGVRRNLSTYQVIIFDPFLEQAPPDTPPGIYDDRVVYEDGMTQSINSTIISPQTFIAAAYQYEGTESVIYNADGSFSLIYFAQGLRLTASAEVVTVPLTAQRPETIVLNTDGTLLYNVQDDVNILQTLMFIGFP